MPLFHFNLADQFRDPDLDGTELIDVAEARTQAIIFAGAYLRDNPRLIENGEMFRLEVTDAYATALFTIKIEMIEHAVQNIDLRAVH